MTEPETHEDRFAVRATSDSHFSWLRTRLSLERTLMAWVRTAISMIGFGFTIVQFFERFGGMNNVQQPLLPEAPRYLGLALIGAGVVSLLISVWQFRQTVNYIDSGPFAPIAGISSGPVQTPIYAICIALIFIGIFAFLAVLTRAI